MIERLARSSALSTFAIYCVAGMDLAALNFDSARWLHGLLWVSLADGGGSRRAAPPGSQRDSIFSEIQHLSLIPDKAHLIKETKAHPWSLFPTQMRAELLVLLFQDFCAE